MQVDPINPTFKAPGTMRSKLEHGELLSRFAFKFNLRRYNLEWPEPPQPAAPDAGSKFAVGDAGEGAVGPSAWSAL